MAGLKTISAEAGDLDSWIAALLQPATLKVMAVLVACGILAWTLVWLARRAASTQEPSILFGRRIVDGVLFPVLLLSLVYLARAIVAGWLPLTLFRIAIPALVALAAIRLGVKVLQVAIGNAPWVRALEQIGRASRRERV